MKFKKKEISVYPLRGQLNAGSISGYSLHVIQRVEKMETKIDDVPGHLQIETSTTERIKGFCEPNQSNDDAPTVNHEFRSNILRVSSDTPGNAPASAFKANERGQYGSARPANVFLANALERERHRIARDLHDHVGQYIVGVMLRLAAIERRIEDADLRMQVSDLRPTLLRFSDELKAISNGINIDIPGGAELIPAFSDMITRWENTVLINTRFEHEPEGGIETDLTTSEVLFRVLQEALTNIAKHASDATLVTVRLSFKASEVMLSIEDDGRGFAASADTDYGCDSVHCGIAGMRERVDEVGGSFEIRSPVNHRGTRVVVTIPLNRH